MAVARSAESRGGASAPAPLGGPPWWPDPLLDGAVPVIIDSPGEVAESERALVSARRREAAETGAPRARRPRSHLAQTGPCLCSLPSDSLSRVRAGNLVLPGTLLPSARLISPHLSSTPFNRRSTARRATTRASDLFEGDGFDYRGAGFGEFADLHLDDPGAVAGSGRRRLEARPPRRVPPRIGGADRARAFPRGDTFLAHSRSSFEARPQVPPVFKLSSSST